MRVKHVMTKDRSSGVPADSAQHAGRIMRDQHAGIVPVIDNDLEPEDRRTRSTSRGSCGASSRWLTPVERADLKTTQTHETLESASADGEPIKPRTQSRKAA